MQKRSQGPEKAQKPQKTQKAELEKAQKRSLEFSTGAEDQKRLGRGPEAHKKLPTKAQRRLEDLGKGSEEVSRPRKD